MTKDKRLEKGVESRKVIIEATIQCIAVRGLCDTTLDHVAELAGVSRALVVFHFKSKKGILSAVLEQISSQYNQQWQAIMTIPDLPANERLLRLIAYDVRLPIEKPELIAVWHTFWGEAKGFYKEFNSTRDEKYEQDLVQLIEQITVEGDYTNINPELVNTALVAMLFGLWWDAHLNASRYDFKRSMEVVTSFLKIHFPRHF